VGTGIYRGQPASYNAAQLDDSYLLWLCAIPRNAEWLECRAMVGIWWLETPEPNVQLIFHKRSWSRLSFLVFFAPRIPFDVEAVKSPQFA